MMLSDVCLSVCLSDVCLTSVTFIRLAGDVCGRPAGWRVLSDRARLGRPRSKLPLRASVAGLSGGISWRPPAYSLFTSAAVQQPSRWWAYRRNVVMEWSSRCRIALEWESTRSCNHRITDKTFDLCTVEILINSFLIVSELVVFNVPINTL